MHQQHQRRYQSLPDGYNPRAARRAGAGGAVGAGGENDEMIYRLRQFSISPKGALIKHGDQIRAKSSAGSTANTSR